MSDYKGEKVVFLNFWGTWCETCKRELLYMDNQYKNYKDQNLEIIAINVGEPEFSVKKFIETYNLSFPVAIERGTNY